MEKKNNSSNGILTGIFAALAGIAIGVGGKLLYDELAKPDENTAEGQYKKHQQKINQRKKSKDGVTDDYKDYDSFLCPISQEIMVDPVITPGGITYDRKSITQWLQKSNICPLTKKPLKESDLVTNYALKMAIDEYNQKHN